MKLQTETTYNEVLSPNNIRVLVACEESQATTIELRKLGFDAWSCDILECSGGHPEWHIHGDVLNVLNDGWDMMIAHPTCTYLTNSGVCWLWNKDKSKNEQRWENLNEGARFFKTLLEAPIPLIAVENPIPHKYAVEFTEKPSTEITLSITRARTSQTTFKNLFRYCSSYGSTMGCLCLRNLAI